MGMNDIHGLPLSTRSAEATEAYNRALASLLGNRTDLSGQLKALLEADPEFSLGHCFRGYVHDADVQPGHAASGGGRAPHGEGPASAATPREQAHVRALGHWVADEVDSALHEWEGLLAEWPHDALAIRLAHFNYFWTGRAADMRASLERVAPAGAMHCRRIRRCSRASRSPWRRPATTPPPSAPGGARSRSTRPRSGARTRSRTCSRCRGGARKGIAWLAGLERHWEGKNNFVHHLWWHRAMFHLELRETDAVLELYDKRFATSPRRWSRRCPTLHRRAERRLDALPPRAAGRRRRRRWSELADKAQARIGDCQSAFTLPHWMMALSATGRGGAAHLMLSSLRENANRVVREVAFPVCEAVLAHRRGDYARAVLCMAPVLDRLHELGGSHAQRDVLHQLYFDACLKSQRSAEARALLDSMAARFPRAAVPARRLRRRRHLERISTSRSTGSSATAISFSIARPQPGQQNCRNWGRGSMKRFGSPTIGFEASIGRSLRTQELL